MTEDTALAQRPEQAIQAVTVEDLILGKIESGMPVETVERLLDMHQRLQKDHAKQAFYEALGAFQSECPVIAKTKRAGSGNFAYNYAPLEAIIREVRPILHKHGLSYRFDTSFEADPPAQRVICVVTHVSGHSEFSEFRTPIDGSGSMNSMQKSASAQTYAKRYAFMNALGILTGDDDDDGQAVGRPGQETSRPPLGGAGPKPAPPPTVGGAAPGVVAGDRAAAPPAVGQPKARGRVITVGKKEARTEGLTPVSEVLMGVEPAPLAEDPVDLRPEMRERCMKLAWEYLRIQQNGVVPIQAQCLALLRGAARKHFSKKWEDLSIPEIDKVFAQMSEHLDKQARGVPT